jgi:hypothetical protein
MRTDYQDTKLDSLARTEQINSSVTYLCLILDRWIDAKLSVKRIKNILSYFPNVSALKIDKRGMNTNEEEWNDFVLKTGLHIVDMTDKWKCVNSIH